MWKDFFYFSRNDKIAIGILSTVIVVSLAILNFRPQRTSLTADTSEISLSDSAALLFRREAQTSVNHQRNTSQRSYQPKKRPFPSD